MRLILNGGQPAQSVPQGSYEITLSPLNGGITLVGFGGETIDVGSPVFGTPVHAVKAAKEITLAGSDNDLTFTAKTAGESGNLITVKYTEQDANEALDVSVDGNAIEVKLGMGPGDNASALMSSGNIIVYADEAGPDGNGLSFEIKMKDSPILDPFGGRLVIAGQGISTGPSTVYLATVTPMGQSISLVESSAGAGQVDIELKYPNASGSWANNKVGFGIEYGLPNSNLLTSCEITENTIIFTTSLPLDSEGDPVDVSDTDLASSISNSIIENNLDDYFDVSVKSSSGVFNTELPTLFFTTATAVYPNNFENVSSAISVAIDSLLGGFSVNDSGYEFVDTEEVVELSGGGANAEVVTTAGALKTAIEANVDANALVAVSSVNPTTGILAGTAVISLEGGSDATVASKNSRMLDANNFYVAIADVTESSTSGWRKIAHSAL